MVSLTDANVRRRSNKSCHKVSYVSRSSRNSDGVTPCGAAKQKWGVKISQFNFRPITCYISKTVEGSWVHAARRLTSTNKFSFDPCNIYRDCPRGVHRGGQNVQNNVLKWRIFTCVSYGEARNRYRLDVCPFVCPSIRLSHAGTVSKRLNLLS